jgi:hypothetical protein
MNDQPTEKQWPTGVGDEPWSTGAISNNPEIAQRLGGFLAEFANLEWSLIWMLAVALGGSSS